MPTHIRILFAILVVFFLGLPLTSSAADYVVKEPPESMDKLYPPVSKTPKWIQQMHKISGHFGGVFVDMREQDWENAETHAAKFVEAYKEANDMVPEWKDFFDHPAAKKFADAVKTRDPAKIGKAAGAIGKTCGKCHEKNYLAVWTRYHWPSVEKIKITDPVGEKELEFGKYMGLLAGSFKGVTVNFQEGQYDRSRKALRAFRKRFMELKSVCSKCHTQDGVKQFFVGPPVAEAFAGMKSELAREKPDAGTFWKNAGTVGRLGCRTCHLTHRSYAIIQDVWEEEEH